MMKKLLALAAAALLLLAAGCNNNPAEPEPKPDPEYPVTVGNVTLTEAPTAVVSLSRRPPKWCTTWAMGNCWWG